MNKVKNKKHVCQQQKRLLRKRIDKQEQALKQATDMIFNKVGQNLSLAKLHLATSKVEQPPRAKEKIADSHDLVAKAITDLRQLGNELNEVIDQQVDNKTLVKYP